MRRLIILLFVSGIAATGANLFGVGPLIPPLWAPPAKLSFDTAADKRAAFVRAYESLRRGDLEPALPVFTALEASYPELADYHLHFTGLISARLGRLDTAEAAFARLLRDYPQSVHVPAAQLELGKLFAATGRVDKARTLLLSALGAADSATVHAARSALAELDERSGDLAAAHAGFMLVRREAVGSVLAQTAKQHVLTLRAQRPDLAPEGSGRLDDVRLLLAEHDYAAAEAAVQQLLREPDGVEPGDALRLYADALYGQGKIEAALTAMWQVAERHPDTAAAPRAMFRMASILWNRDRDAAALRAFEEFRHRYPRDRRTAEALYAIGRIHQQAGRSAAAVASYAELVRRSPREKLAGEAQWRIGWIRYVDAHWTAAAATFARLAGRTPSRQREAAAYWQARALERAGRPAAARAVYRKIVQRDKDGYYAMWAQRRLGTASGELTTRTSGVLAPTEPVRSDPPALIDTFHLTRADELKITGLFSLSRGELSAIERAQGYDTGTLRYLVGAYQTVDGYADALRLVRRLGRRAGLSAAERDRLLYPLAFWTSVRREAEANHVAPLLVIALMRQESLFDPAARSAADARGLMQLLPATAQKVAAVAAPVPDQADWTDPDMNIQLGIRYLRGLLDRFHGDPLKALAAYNGGETAVDKWDQRFGHLDTDEFVESISYRETRDYVKRVMANYRKYQRLYAGT